MLKLDADEEGAGDDDTADILRYQLAMNAREVKVSMLKGGEPKVLCSPFFHARWISVKRYTTYAAAVVPPGTQ